MQIQNVRIHAVVGIGHRLPPVGFPRLRQRARRSAILVHGGEMPDQIAEQMQHAAGIFLAEAAERAVGAARIERKDRLQMRRLLLGDMELFGAESRDADHADIAVAPWLRGDPLDQIVAVPLPRAAALGFADTARRSDDVDIAARH